MKNLYLFFLKLSKAERFRILVCIISGIFSSIPFFLADLFILEWISYIPFFIILISQKESNAKKLFLYGFFSHFSRSVIVLSWFKELYSMSALDYPPAVMIMIIIVADVGLSALQAIPFGIFSILAAKVFKFCPYAVANSAAAAAFFTLSELIHTLAEQFHPFGFVGFPWVVTYITQQNFINGIQTASVFGAHFITFLIFLFSSLVAYAFIELGKKRILLLSCALSVFFLNFIFGYCTVSLSDFTQENTQNKKISTIIYQDNHSSYDKWDASSTETCDEFIEDMEEYFQNNSVPDLILLSETVFTATLNTDPHSDSVSGKYITERLAGFSEKYGTIVICGGFYENDGLEYNALFMFDNGKVSDTVYKKRTLVPFGEYIPFEDLLTSAFKDLENFNLRGSYLSPGNSSEVFDSSIGKLGGIICYDSIFYYNSSESVREGAEIIVLSTNDSWYNDSAAAFQHYAHSVFRAVENRKFVIRAATTGISGIIDSFGRTLKSSELLKKSVICGTAYLNDKITLFSQYGYLYFYIFLFLAVCYFMFFKLYYKKKQTLGLNFSCKSI